MLWLAGLQVYDGRAGVIPQRAVLLLSGQFVRGRVWEVMVFVLRGSHWCGVCFVGFLLMRCLFCVAHCCGVCVVWLIDVGFVLYDSH